MDKLSADEMEEALNVKIEANYEAFGEETGTLAYA